MRAVCEMHGRDAFHRVPILRLIGDAVERVPTRGGAQETARPTKIFGARKLAGVAGHARRCKNTHITKKDINV